MCQTQRCPRVGKLHHPCRRPVSYTLRLNELCAWHGYAVVATKSRGRAQGHIVSTETERGRACTGQGLGSVRVCVRRSVRESVGAGLSRDRARRGRRSRYRELPGGPGWLVCGPFGPDRGTTLCRDRGRSPRRGAGLSGCAVAGGDTEYIHAHHLGKRRASGHTVMKIIEMFRLYPFLVVHFPKILLPLLNHCSGLARVLVSPSRWGFNDRACKPRCDVENAPPRSSACSHAGGRDLWWLRAGGLRTCRVFSHCPGLAART